MKYEYRQEWYDSAGNVFPIGEKERKPGKRGFFATAGSVALCIAACYMAGGVLGAGTLSSDGGISPLASFSDVASGESGGISPSASSGESGAWSEEASYVMSWVLGERDEEYAETSNDGDDTGESDDEAEDQPSADRGADRIRELADAYIAERTPGSEE